MGREDAWSEANRTSPLSAVRGLGIVAINEIAQSQDEVMTFVMGTNSTERKVRVVEEPPR